MSNTEDMRSRLIYSSSLRCSQEELSQLVEQSRGFNAAHDITGALYIWQDRFLQYLEGNDVALAALYSRIQRDERHTNCELHDARLVSKRVFRGWAMAWLSRPPETDLILQAIDPKPMSSSALESSTVAALFLALSEAAKRS